MSTLAGVVTSQAEPLTIQAIKLIVLEGNVHLGYVYSLSDYPMTKSHFTSKQTSLFLQDSMNINDNLALFKSKSFDVFQRTYLVVSKFDDGHSSASDS